MSKDDSLANMKGALGGLLGSLPDGARQKILDCEAMRVLWTAFPEGVKRSAAPYAISRIAKDDSIELVCEIWIEDPMVKEALLREKNTLLRKLAENIGRVAIENFSFKVVKREKLRELINAIER